ncbi:MAG: PKD domain-containing protein [Vicinamibacterales bacterium]
MLQRRGAVLSVTAAALVFLAVGCEKMPLLAPTDSTITVVATQKVVGINGATDITAQVLESSGTPVQNGTLVTFSTTLGTMKPAEVRTVNGRATSTLQAGPVSGTATVTVVSGAASATVEGIQIGAAAASSVLLSATPPAVPASGGTVALTAMVFDASGNRLSGIPVAFSTTAGTLSAAMITTDAEGAARASLTTSQDATVTATAGAASATFAVTATPLPAPPTVTLTAPSANNVAGQPVVFTVTAQPGDNTVRIREVEIDYGDGDSENLGAISGSSSIAHVYENAGTYRVTATARDSNGQTATATSIIFVAEAPPLQVTVTAGAITRGRPVTLTATVTGATTTTVERVVWDFGDGAQATTTGLTTTHVYSVAGTYVVSVTVTTANGATGLGRVEIVVP